MSVVEILEQYTVEAVYRPRPSRVVRLVSSSTTDFL